MAESSLASDIENYCYDGNDYSAFEPRSTAVPAYVPPKKKKTKSAPERKKTEKVEKKQNVKNKEKENPVISVKKQIENIYSVEGKKNVRMSAMRIGVLLGTGTILLSFIGLNIGMRATIDTVVRENNKIEKQIAVANSESVRLNTEVDAMFSPDKIDDYAVNVLGMVKLEDYKVRYFDFENKDKVIISGNKEYK